MRIHNENFDEIQKAKKERFEELAEKNHTKASEEFEQSKKMADIIPFGQPILVGHHSEKADRNYRNRIDNKMRKSIETSNKADYYDSKVKAIENNHAIRQDDPEAIQKLKAKLEKIEKNIESIKEHNKNCKGIFLKAYAYGMADYQSVRNEVTDLRVAEIKNGVITYQAKKPKQEIIKLVEALVKTGKLPEQKPITPRDQKLPSYHLTNLSSEKNRIKKRIIQIQELEKIPDIDETINKIRIYTDEGRIRMDFGYKPSEETRTKLKQNSFKWSPYNQVWQNYIKQRNIDTAREIAQEESN